MTECEGNRSRYVNGASQRLVVMLSSMGFEPLEIAEAMVMSASLHIGNAHGMAAARAMIEGVLLGYDEELGVGQDRH